MFCVHWRPPGRPVPPVVLDGGVQRAVQPPRLPPLPAPPPPPVPRPPSRSPPSPKGDCRGMMPCLPLPHLPVQVRLYSSYLPCGFHRDVRCFYYVVFCVRCGFLFPWFVRRADAIIESSFVGRWQCPQASWIVCYFGPLFCHSLGKVWPLTKARVQILQDMVSISAAVAGIFQ